MGAYYPDIVIESESRVIEVKSIFTFLLGIDDGTLLLKMAGCLLQGWNATVEVWQPTGDLPEFEIEAIDLLAD